MTTEESEDNIRVDPTSACQTMRLIKKDLEVMYKELMKVLFGAENPDLISREQLIPLENKINQLIERINDSVDELESSH